MDEDPLKVPEERRERERERRSSPTGWHDSRLNLTEFKRLRLSPSSPPRRVRQTEQQPSTIEMPTISRALIALVNGIERNLSRELNFLLGWFLLISERIALQICRDKSLRGFFSMSSAYVRHSRRCIYHRGCQKIISFEIGKSSPLEGC